MNKLNNIDVYLAGPINYVADDGVAWRRDIKEKVSIFNPSINFLDPCDKPHGLGSEIGGEKERARQLKEQGRFKELREFVKTYRRYDLRMVDKCDLFIIYINTNVHMCGSYNELHFAEQSHKPIFAIIEGGPKKAPDWLFSQVRWNEMFDSVDQCAKYIEAINAGIIPLDDRWVLFNGHG